MKKTIITIFVIRNGKDITGNMPIFWDAWTIGDGVYKLSDDELEYSEL